jgi:hypothetical protein
MNENRFRILGRTGLKVGRLGVACSYGAPTAALEEAFEQGGKLFLLALDAQGVHANYRRFFG